MLAGREKLLQGLISIGPILQIERRLSYWVLACASHLRQKLLLAHSFRGEKSTPSRVRAWFASKKELEKELKKERTLPEEEAQVIGGNGRSDGWKWSSRGKKEDRPIEIWEASRRSL
ncbi:hypothetical protein LR48_Vigan07g176500 [Vigna angularis]|uniref:Uncharacterized protein n=1 Tax=Phaseolus angularis TaxID=3914 RepID=A0A0L9UZE2_PHAAN|nr:hypothetical protein LR48_Vigan07g176500 [Vigna angularis]